jgi:hypothetical protein
VPSVTSLVLREPAAIAALVASIVPLALAFGLRSPIGREETAALIVAINGLVAFALRFVVSPAPVRVRQRTSAAERLAS